jgi:PAS domain-containing protein
VFITGILEDPIPAVVASALDALRQIGGPDEIEAFAVPLRSQDRAIRISAINGVLEMGRRHNRMLRSSELLADALFYSKEAACVDHLSGIGRTGRRSAWATAAPYLRDTDPLIRTAAAAAITNLAHPESAGLVLEHLAQETDPRTRVQLASAARALNARQAVGILVEWLRDDDQTIFKTAVDILPALTGKSFGEDADKWSQWWEQVRPR